MKKEEERLELLLQSKKVTELTAEEKEFVLHMLGSLEDFESMQRLESAAMNLKTVLKPNPLVLLSLKAQMRERHLASSAWAMIFNFKVPAYAAILVVLVSSALTAGFNRPNAKMQPTISVTERIDTLIVTKIDTVIKERVVYRLTRNHAAPPAQGIPTEPTIESLAPKAIGVSMKEKEELNKLLVSGSE